MNQKQLQQKILKCNRCGTCQDVCPTFKVSGDENDVARSRLRLTRMVLEGKYSWGSETEMTSHLQSCLLCKACVTVCPSNVPTDEIMIQARAETNIVKGLPLFNRLAYRGVFSNNMRLVVLGKLIRFYQKSGTRWVVKNSGVLKLLGEMGKAFSEKVKDINEFLVGINFIREIGTVSGIATYHDPCHLARGQKNSLDAREIIRSIPGLEFREMKEADMCCGGAGSYGALHPEMSRKILDRKMNNFKETGADILITSCPACAMQLEYGMRRHGLAARVLHPVQLIDLAFKASEGK